MALTHRVRENSAAAVTSARPEQTSARSEKTRVRVVRRHHAFVRWSHWLLIPVLAGLVLSGISIYWASPIYQHKADPETGNFDYLADAGIWICAHVPALHDYSNPEDWVYNHFSLGPHLLAPGLRLHWFFAYLFMLLGVAYFAGLALGGGWRTLWPRRTDLLDGLRMLRYYLGVPFAVLTRRKWVRPHFDTQYNTLQRLAYLAIALAGVLVVATGWAIHKPMQLQWLAAIFGGYEAARVWHFWLMLVFIIFAVPHVILVFADGWDTLRSMIVGWSVKDRRADELQHER